MSTLHVASSRAKRLRISEHGSECAARVRARAPEGRTAERELRHKGTVLGQPKSAGDASSGKSSLLEYLHAQRLTQLYKDLPLTLGDVRTLTRAPHLPTSQGFTLSQKEGAKREALGEQLCQNQSGEPSACQGRGLWAQGRAGGREGTSQGLEAILSPSLASSHSPLG